MKNNEVYSISKEELFIKQFGRKYNKKIACMKIMDTLKKIVKEEKEKDN